MLFNWIITLIAWIHLPSIEAGHPPDPRMERSNEARDPRRRRRIQSQRRRGVAQKALVAPGDTGQSFGRLSNGMMGDGG